MKLKQSLAIAMAVSAALGIASCSSGSGDPSEKIDYIPVQQEDDGNWSFYSPDGDLKLEDEFKETPSAVVEGYFSVEEGKGYTLYKFGDKLEPVKGCEELKSVGYFSDGLIPVVFPKERISIVNGSGEKVATLEPVDGKEITSSEIAFSEGLLVVNNQDGLYGYVNTKGECVIKPQYSSATPFVQGIAIVTEMNEEGELSKTIAIGKKGEELFTLRSSMNVQSTFAYGKLLVSDANDRYVFLDKKGEELYKCPSKVTGVSGFCDNYYVFRTSDGVYGVMDYKGEQLIRPKYDEIGIIDGDRVLAIMDDRIEILNLKGESLLRLDDYRGAFYAGKFGLGVRDKRTYSFLDLEGKPKKNSEFNRISMAMSTCYAINSDYFNMKAVVDEVCSMITAKGVGEYVLGEAPSAHFTDPGSYCYSSKAEASELAKQGYLYSIRVEAQFSSTMADYSYGFTGNGYGRTNYWRSGCELVGMRIYVNASTDWGNDGSQAIVERLQTDGYKLLATTDVASDSYIALLQKGEILVTVSSDKGSWNGRVVVQKATAPTVDEIQKVIVDKGGKVVSSASVEQKPVEQADSAA